MDLFTLVGTISVKYTDAIRQLEEVTRTAQRTDNSFDDVTDSADDTDDSMHHLGDTIDETEDSLSDLTDTTQNTNRILDDTSDSVSETDDNIDDMTDTVDDADTKFGTWQATLANLASTALQRIIDKCTELAKSVVELGIDFTGTMSEVQAISGASDEDLQMLEETARHFGATTKFSATEAAEGLKYMSMAGWTAEQSASALGGVLDLAAASGEELGTTSDIVTDAMTAFGMQADEAGHFADVLATASSNANTNVSMLGESFKYCAPVAGSMGANVEDVSIALGLMANAGIKGSAAGNSLKNALVNLVKPTKQQAAAMANLGLMNTEMVRTFDDEAITKAQSKVADKTGELEKKQIAYNQAVQKYGAESAQAQSKLIDIEKAERNLTEAQDALTKAQEGTIEAIQTGGNVFTDEEGNMKSLSEIMNILRENLGGLDADMTDEEGNLRDLDEVISELSQTEEGLTQAQQLQNAAILFGKQNLSGMLAVINASEEDYNKLADAIYNSEDAASNMAKTMNDNLKGDLESMNSAWEEFKLKIFDSVESPLRNVVQFITTVVVPALTDLIQNFDKIAPVLTGLVTALATFKTAMAISGIISAATKAFQAYQVANEGATVAQWLFNGALNASPMMIIISLIAGLISALVVLWNTNEEFRNAVLSIFDSIKNAVQNAWNFFEGYGEYLYDWLSGTISTVSEFFTGIWNFFVGYGEYLYDWLNGIVSAVSGFFSNIWNFFVGYGEYLYDWIHGIMDTTVSIFTAIKDFITGIFDAIYSTIYTIINTIYTTIVNVWTAIYETVKPLLDAFAYLFDTIFQAIQILTARAMDWIAEKISAVWNAIVGFITPILESIKNTFETIWNGIADVISVVLDSIHNVIMTIWNAISDFISEVLNTISNIVSAVWNAILGFISGILNGIFTVVSNIWNGISTVISNVLNTIFTTVSTIWNNIKTAIENVMNTIKTTVSNIWDSVKTAISDKVTSIKDSIVNGFNTAVDFVKNLAGQAWQWGADIIDNIVTGIKEKINNVADAVTGVADTIREYLHFSVPDKGPLTDFESWMPDFMNGLANGINSSKNKIDTALNSVAESMQNRMLSMIASMQNIWKKVSTVFRFDNIITNIQNVFAKIKNLVESAGNTNISRITNGLDSVQKTVISVLTAIHEFLTRIFADIIRLTQGDMSAIQDIITTILNAVRSVSTTIWNGIFAFISSVIDNIRNKVRTGFEDVRMSIFEKLTNARTIVTTIFDAILNAINSKIESAKNIVKNGIDRIKDFFNFSWSLPHLKLPHFNISGEFSLDPPSVPTFGIDWYAKGGIMTEPTVFGFNPSTGNAQVGGEAGAEAIAPIDMLLGYVRTAVQEENQALAQQVESIIVLLTSFFPVLLQRIPKEVVLDTGAVVGELTPAINEELGNISDDDERRRG